MRISIRSASQAGAAAGCANLNGSPILLARRPTAPGAPAGLPIVHILIPSDFRDADLGARRAAFAYSWANIGAGLFQGFAIGSSLSKSAANDRAGAHSQMSGIIAAAVTVVVALFFTQFFYALPEAALGAIVIVAVSGMVKVAKIKHLYQVRRSDFILAIVALLAVLTFETLEALLIAVIVSLFALVWRASQPKLADSAYSPR